MLSGCRAGLGAEQGPSRCATWGPSSRISSVRRRPRRQAGTRPCWVPGPLGQRRSPARQEAEAGGPYTPSRERRGGRRTERRPRGADAETEPGASGPEAGRVGHGFSPRSSGRSGALPASRFGPSSPDSELGPPGLPVNKFLFFPAIWSVVLRHCSLRVLVRLTVSFLWTPLYILDTSPSSNVSFANNVLPVGDLSFYSLNSVFHRAKVFFYSNEV